MRLPWWIRNKYRQSDLHATKSILRDYGVSTVCEEARCPNKGSCFRRSAATFMILGETCTRDCGFCAVSSGRPSDIDMGEPGRVALAAKHMGLRYVVVTSVTRDDLQDGGAMQFAMTIKALKEEIEGVKVEVLTPDFGGDADALRTVLDAVPDVFNHNVETVPRLYKYVRPEADYWRSMHMIRKAGEIDQGIITKSGIMLGLGERLSEVIEVLEDLRAAGCDLLTIGQYLRPGRRNVSVQEYIPPRTFMELGEIAYGMGFRHVISSPLARSSMNADEMYGSLRS